MDNEKLEKVKTFMKKEGLFGTNLKLKESILKADVSLANAKKELDEALKNVNNKQSDVFALAQRLESLCLLATEVENEEKQDV